MVENMFDLRFLKVKSQGQTAENHGIWSRDIIKNGTR